MDIFSSDKIESKQIDGIAEYATALDALCSIASRNLYLFDENFERLGFNSEHRCDALRRFLLSSSMCRLHMLAHDTSHLAKHCPRIVSLLSHFDSRMFIHQSNKRRATAPFCVVDNAHYVRRFHFDGQRGVMAMNDSLQAHALESRFQEMWADSRQSLSAGKFGL
jgi:hypothetical protein